MIEEEKEVSSMVKVSVIIPVYNSEKFIHKCLDSVLTQTLQDIEVICVDDASTDKSYEILEEYAKCDNRIVVLRNNANGGLSYTRNHALEHASGEYIQFVDSDDFIEADLLEKNFELSKEKDLDVLETDCLTHTLDMTRTIVKESLPTDVLTGIEYQKRYGINGFSVWKYFIKLEFWKKNKLRFYEGIIHEDVLLVYEMMKNADRFFYAPYAKYHYMKTNSVITAQVDKNYNYYCFLKVVNQIINEPSDSQYMISILEMIRPLMMTYRRKSCNYMQREKWETEIVELEKIFLGEQYIDAAYIYENRNRINACQRRYIYGAGIAAGQLLEELDRYEIGINGFIVTKKEGRDVYMGHTIIPLADFNEKPEDCMIVVAIASKGVNAVISDLQDRGYKNILYACKCEWREK